MIEQHYGPTLPISEEIHAMKYRQPGETFDNAMCRIAGAIADNDEHYWPLLGILRDMRFLPAGRVQAAVGAARAVTPFNCFVSPTIPDSMDGIVKTLGVAAETMRMGGGIGYDYSTLRPAGAAIRSLSSEASGPVSFMSIFDALCGTISSAGHRRGAQMGVLRVDHPDILEFIRAKTNTNKLTNFNISVAITDEFMDAVENGRKFSLRFNGQVYQEVDATHLWKEILRASWDWAEPGVLFIDRINGYNNLGYCEDISATNPCAEQPLPPNGACLLGSFNLVKYIKLTNRGTRAFNYAKFTTDISHVVRAMDNVIDISIYPTEAQELEARRKRRMGLGVTGLANAVEALGHPYGSQEFLKVSKNIFHTLFAEAYATSVCLAREKGAFPYYADCYSGSLTLDNFPELRKDIKDHGIRNSHLISFAPTGTISLTADNVSSGIEPVFAKSYTRTIRDEVGSRKEVIEDYGVRMFGTEPKTANECTWEDHIAILNLASQYSDSAVSKTCNVPKDIPWEDFSKLYFEAYKGGAKGCTVFRDGCKRVGILTASTEPSETENVGVSCFYDPETGKKTCE